ncbi:MAG: hypothetical protein FWG26_08710 [Betaproteobacteria bacterium]|nr:hypothetical protein [Betaproteobacteria bacterium]
MNDFQITQFINQITSFLKQQIKNLKKKWLYIRIYLYLYIKKLPLYARIYRIGFIICIIGIFLTPLLKLSSDSLWWHFAMTFFVVGFVVFSWKYYKACWKHPIGRVVFLIIHAAIFVIAQGYSNNFVASALGLPPQDYSITVYLFAFLFYIPVCFYTIAIVFMIPLVVFTVIFSIYILVTQVGIIVPSNYIRELISKKIMKKLFESNIAFHFMGLAIVMGTFADSAGFLLKQQYLLFPVAHLSAYAFDFQNVRNYPCITETQRVRIHENGVISVATMKSENFAYVLEGFLEKRVDIEITSLDKLCRSLNNDTNTSN